MGIPTYHTNLLEFDGMVNLMKGAIETADRDRHRQRPT